MLVHLPKPPRTVGRWPPVVEEQSRKKRLSEDSRTVVAGGQWSPEDSGELRQSFYMGCHSAAWFPKHRSLGLGPNIHEYVWERIVSAFRYHIKI